MKYTHFFIEKYKAISNVKIPLNNIDFIPIIGINESGKTSILHAILSFDHLNDDNLGGQHLNAKNRYEYDATGHNISAEIVLDDVKDLDILREELGIKKSYRLYKDLEFWQKHAHPLTINRNLDNRKYNLKNDLGISEETSIKLINCLLKNSPFILLFDDFTDRVPEKIIFSSTYLQTDYIPAEDSNRTEWNVYLEEIFKRATNGQYTLKRFLNTQKDEDRKGILSDISDRLNTDVITDWERLKVLKGEIKDEIKKLKLYLDYNKDNIGNHVFSFNVEDKNFQSRVRHFQIVERSKGFQWFFNFAIKLKYNPKYSKDFKGAIYLLDEPGSYLHSSAQEELLKSLKSISNTNKVIYCTHSQYLLNPDIINVNNIKISNRNKDNGLISLINFSEYPSNYHQGALSPLIDALHLNITKHINFKEENIVITEGITDYYFLKMINKYMNVFDNLNFVFVPGAGAPELKELISFAITWSKRYTVIMDSDTEGRRQFGRYKKFFGEKESEKWILYSFKNNPQNIVLEDFLLSKDHSLIKKITNASDVKHGIMSLYFMDEALQNDFFIKIQEGSKTRIQYITEIIKSKFN